ncbi:unnamed protein product [Closterium sp. NIES-65]|nr:unnamed protein product [Closterium sp. NIES-65]
MLFRWMWHLGGMWVACGWHVGGMWVASGRHMGGMWAACWRHVDGMWAACGRRVGGMGGMRAACVGSIRVARGWQEKKLLVEIKKTTKTGNEVGVVTRRDWCECNQRLVTMTTSSARVGEQGLERQVANLQAEWHAVSLDVASRWHAGGMWAACGRHVGGMWAACGWHVGGMRGACGQHVSGMWQEKKLLVEIKKTAKTGNHVGVGNQVGVVTKWEW